MQCGRELAEAQEALEKSENREEELKEELRLTKIQLETLKHENVGEKFNGDLSSQKTGIMS